MSIKDSMLLKKIEGEVEVLTNICKKLDTGFGWCFEAIKELKAKSDVAEEKLAEVTITPPGVTSEKIKEVFKAKSKKQKKKTK